MAKSVVYLASTLTVLGLAACSGGGGGGASSSSSAMAVSGTLATGTVSAMDYQPNEKHVIEKPLSVSSYGVRCVTLASTPQSGEGQCDSSGHFSLSIPGAAGIPIGCFVISGTGGSAAVVATLSFQAASTDLNGNPSRSGSYVASGSTTALSMGSVTLDLNKGMAVVPTTQIALTGGTQATLTGSFADMTGPWTIHALSSVPAGYVSAGTGDDGPTDGQTIYLGYYSATDGTNPHHGLSVWQSEASLTSCNGEGVTLPMGWTLTPASAPNTLLTTSSNVATTFPQPSTVSITCGGGTSMWGLPSSYCSGATSSNGWTSTHNCGEILASPISSSGSWLGGSGSTSVSAHWNMTPAQAAFQCMLNNVNSNSGTCTGEVIVDWSNIWQSGNSSIMSGIGYSGSAWTGLTADSSSSDAVTYVNGAIRFSKSPRNRFMMGEFTVNGNVGSLTDHKDFTQSACTGAYSTTGSSCTTTMTTCHVSENSKITITQTSSTSALVELVQVRAVSASDNAVCANDQFISNKLGAQKWMFTLSK